MRARMATMRMQMRRKKHRKPIMDQCRVSRTEGIVGDVDRYEYEYGDDADGNEKE